MEEYAELIKALRCNQGNGLCPYADCEYKSKNAPICMPTRLTNDAADAIVALGLDNEDYEHENRRLHGEIEALQAEIRESMQKCAECGDAQEQKVKELQDKVFELEEELNDADIAADDNGRQIDALQSELERLKDSNEELRENQTYIDHYGDKWMTSAKDVPTAAYKHGYADGMAEERAKMQKRIEELEAKNKELHGRIEDKELQIDMLTADNTNCDIAIDKLKAEVKKAAKRNAELHAELEKWVSAAEQEGESKRGEWVRVENEESYHYECSRCGERPLYSRYGDVVLSGVCPMCGAEMEVQDGKD